MVGDGFAFKHSCFNKGNKTCFSAVLVETNIKWLFVHMSGNKQSIYGNGLAMLVSLVMCTVYTNKFTFRHLKLTWGFSKNDN